MSVIQENTFDNMGVGQTGVPEYNSEEDPVRGIVRASTIQAETDEDELTKLLRSFSLNTPPSYHLQNIPADTKPTVIPQTGSLFDDPFIRAYTPQLEAYGVSEKDWLAFQDALNIALIGSPPLRIVDMAGAIIGFVPYHWAIVAGMAINVTAQTAVHIVSKSLSERLLRKMNADYFSPRGLAVRIMSLEAMKAVIGVEPEPEKETGFNAGLKKFGNKVGDGVLFFPIPLPISSAIVKKVRPAEAPKVEDGSTPKERLLNPLLPYISPLNFDVPEAEPVTGTMDKVSNKGLQMRAWMQRNEDEKTTRLRESSANGQPMRKGYFRRDQDVKMSNWRAKRKLGKANMREERRSKKSMWLCVLTLEQDSMIQGKQFEDDPKMDVEQIEQAEWEAEMENERQRYENDSEYSEDDSGYGEDERYELDGTHTTGMSSIANGVKHPLART